MNIYITSVYQKGSFGLKTVYSIQSKIKATFVRGPYFYNFGAGHEDKRQEKCFKIDDTF